MLLSVVIPTIGREGYLNLAIESLINQTEPFDEIIVFDNSIEQNIENKLNKSKIINLKFIKSGVHLDQINSWNRAVEGCSHDYIAILGDDDIALPNFSSCVRKSLKEEDVVIARAITIDKFGNKIGELPYGGKNKLKYSEFFKERLNGNCSLFVPGIAFKKNLFHMAGGFINTFIEGYAYSDELLLLSMTYLNQNIEITEDTCWQYRIHAEQLAGVKSIENIMDKSVKYVNIFKNHMDHIGFSDSEDLYFGLRRSSYIKRVVLYNLSLYSIYSGYNESFLLFQKNIIKNLYILKRIDLIPVFKLHNQATQIFLKNTKFGRWLKKLIKR